MSLYECALDKIDPIKTFQETVMSINSNNPVMYTKLMSGISA